MAKLVDFRTFTPKDSGEDLARRLQEAPEEHAEAIRAGYDLRSSAWREFVVSG